MHHDPYSSSYSSDEDTLVISISQSISHQDKQIEETSYFHHRSHQAPRHQQSPKKTKTSKTTTSSGLTDPEKQKARSSLSFAGFSLDRLTHNSADRAKAILWAAETGDAAALAYCLALTHTLCPQSRHFPFTSTKSNKLAKPESWLVATTNSYNTTPLHLAAAHGHTAAASILLSHGAPIAQLSKSHGTPLHAAARHGHTDTVRLLLSSGAEIDAQTSAPTRQTPLQLAAAADHEDTLRLLLLRGADPNAGSYREGRALHFAARRGNLVAVHLLLEAGAEVDDVDGEGRTALHVAAQLGGAEVAFVLVARGATVNLRDNKGETALEVGMRGGEEGGC